MRFSRVCALMTTASLLAACGGDSNGPSNTPPTANFTFYCSDLACIFTDHSSDVDGRIESQAWHFGDGQDGTGITANHTYSQGGTYPVVVTATDNGGARTTSADQAVTVTAGSPGGPTANFTVTCISLDCTIVNTSTAAGAAVTWAWDFGNGQTSTEQNPPPVHYNVTTLTTFTITLVVTSDGLSSRATGQVIPTPPAELTCGNMSCTLGLEQAAVVVVTLTHSNCRAHRDTFIITAPAVDTLLTDGCYAPVAPATGSSFTLNDGLPFTAGTELDAEVLTGVAGAENPLLRVTGNFQSGWTLEFDDGFVAAGEPDFNDLVITIKATAAP
ncbi:MAG: PKD domain-containing protein [Gemmatimonadales bacterium]